MQQVVEKVATLIGCPYACVIGSSITSAIAIPLAGLISFSCSRPRINERWTLPFLYRVSFSNSLFSSYCISSVVVPFLLFSEFVYFHSLHTSLRFRSSNTSPKHVVLSSEISFQLVIPSMEAQIQIINRVLLFFALF